MSTSRKKSGDVVPIKQGLPAIAKPRHRWVALDALARNADILIERIEMVRSATWNIRRIENALNQNEPSTVGSFPDDFMLSPSTVSLVADCREAIALLDPEARYDDGELQREHITKRLAILVGAYPAGMPSTPEVYVKDLLEHVFTGDGLTYLALDAACRTLEAEKTFRPSIAEVLKAIKDQQDVWEDRIAAIEGIEASAWALAQERALLRPVYEAAIAAWRVENASYYLRNANSRQEEAFAANQEAIETAAITKVRLAKCETIVARRAAELAAAKAHADEADAAAGMDQCVMWGTVK